MYDLKVSLVCQSHFQRAFLIKQGNEHVIYNIMRLFENAKNLIRIYERSKIAMSSIRHLGENDTSINKRPLNFVTQH